MKRGVLNRMLGACVLAALAGCHDWRKHVDPAAAKTAPVQTEVRDRRAIDFYKNGYRITLTPKAQYRIKGYVADTSRKLLDEWDFVMPLDLGIIWGPIADPQYLEHMSFHLTKRYFSWRYEPPRGGPMLPLEVGRYTTNNHLIPATAEIKRVFDGVKPGHLVTIEGRLVDMVIRNADGSVAVKAPTSISRRDSGNGACEQIWVESIEVEKGAAKE